jgi:mannose-6-phosphate isomerase-like protein (cupin superfamily)
VSILNGELNVKDIHILFMKSEPIDKQIGKSLGYGHLPSSTNYVNKPLGNHKHWYPEVMYVLKGKCHYWLKNKEGETMECDLEEGDIMFRAPEVVHTCLCTEDTILLDGSSESWISEDWNHVREVLKE